MIDVSIIIPTYNRLWSLEKAIESCRDTNCKTEIIVIDDGSTDGTWNWLQTQKDLICKKQFNCGKCEAVNHGFVLAKGKYIRFLDSDDMLNRSAMDEQFYIAEKENADLVVGGFSLISESGQIIKEIKWVNCDDFISQQLGECDSSHYSAYLFNKEFINDIRHRAEFTFRDDRMFVLEAALKDPRISIHSGIALYHRQHQKPKLQNTLGLSQSVQNFQHLKLYQRILNCLEYENKLSQRRKNAAVNILWPLANWTAKHNLQEGLEIMNWIYKLNPAFVIPNRGLLGYMYKSLGFKRTQQVLKLRRFCKYG